MTQALKTKIVLVLVLVAGGLGFAVKHYFFRDTDSAVANESIESSDHVVLDCSSSYAGGDRNDLIRAIHDEDVDAVSALLSGGANPGESVLLKGIGSRRLTTTPLIEAAKVGNADIVSKLLDRGANPNDVATSRAEPDFAGWGPLEWASCLGHLHVAERLLAKGANANLAPGGSAALAVANKNGFSKMATLLVSHGATTKPKF